MNLRIPVDAVDDATEFYAERLGFTIEQLERYRNGTSSFFDVRLTPEHIIHLWPTTDFAPPRGDNYHHLALTVEADTAALKERLVEAAVPIVDEAPAALGADGRSPAVYIEDPFGYRLELKPIRESPSEVA